MTRPPLKGLPHSFRASLDDVALPSQKCRNKSPSSRLQLSLVRELGKFSQTPAKFHVGTSNLADADDIFPLSDKPRAPLGRHVGDARGENESAHLFRSIRSGGMLDISQASTDASWGILARFFSPATAGPFKTSTTRSLRQATSSSSARRSQTSFAPARIKQDRTRTHPCNQGHGRSSYLAAFDPRETP